MPIIRKSPPPSSHAEQNEPEFAAPWEACVWDASAQRDWITEDLGPVRSTCMYRAGPDLTWLAISTLLLSVYHIMYPINTRTDDVLQYPARHHHPTRPCGHAQVLKHYHPDLKLLAFDHNKDHLLHWADTILGR